MGSSLRSRHTPHLDRLAREGFCFQHAVAPSSWTKSSVASRMTGLHPGHHGAIGTERDFKPLVALQAGHVTLAEPLKDAGYRTAAFVTNPLTTSPLESTKPGTCKGVSRTRAAKK